MRKKRSVVGLLGLLVVCSGAVSEDGSSWSRDSLLSWVGKYPTALVDGQKRSIFDEKTVSRDLRQLLPQAEKQRLDACSIETPVKRIREFLVIHKCRPHNCPSEFAMVVIDVERPRIWAGFFARDTGRVSTRWYGSRDDYSALPQEIQKEFLAKHGD